MPHYTHYTHYIHYIHYMLHSRYTHYSHYRGLDSTKGIDNATTNSEGGKEEKKESSVLFSENEYTGRGLVHLDAFR